MINLNKIKSLWNNDKGFTLIELMITLAISGFVMAGIYASYVSQVKVDQTQKEVTYLQQGLRAAAFYLEKEIRMAGYDPYGVSSGASILSAGINGIRFTYVADDDGDDNDGDGTKDERGELKTIEFLGDDAYNDGDNDLCQRTGSAAGGNLSGVQPIAENIDRLEFNYTLLDKLTGQITQKTNPLNSELDDIIGVQISILARDKRAIRSPSEEKRSDEIEIDSRIYNPSSGVAWGPFKDHHRRRFAICRIQCRNMGI